MYLYFPFIFRCYRYVQIPSTKAITLPPSIKCLVIVTDDFLPIFVAPDTPLYTVERSQYPLPTLSSCGFETLEPVECLEVVFTCTGQFDNDFTLPLLPPKLNALYFSFSIPFERASMLNGGSVYPTLQLFNHPLPLTLESFYIRINMYNDKKKKDRIAVKLPWQQDKKWWDNVNEKLKITVEFEHSNKTTVYTR